MREKVPTGRAIVFRDAQGGLSWSEFKDNKDAQAIIAAREKQGLSVLETTTRDRAVSLVNPPVPQDSDMPFFGR